jgi:hypothetical protein
MEKARDLTTPILGRDKSKGLIDTIYTIETVTDIRNLRTFLQPG